MWPLRDLQKNSGNFDMEVLFFKTLDEFRSWMDVNHQTMKELWVGFYKSSLKREGIAYPDSVDVALCYGWIDGIRKSIDSESYCNRFTPRKPRSNWSEINIAKVHKLIEQGLMKPAGLKLFEQRMERRAGEYSYENKPEKLSDDLETVFRSNEKAWKYFNSLSPSHRKTVYFWIMSAKQESTKMSRLIKLIDASEAGKKL